MPEVEVLSRKTKLVYSIAESRLAKISTCSPKGITLEEIKKAVGSLVPRDWYEGKMYEEKIPEVKEPIFFELLSTEDQEKVISAIKRLTEATSEEELVDICNECGLLVLEFDDKVNPDKFYRR